MEKSFIYSLLFETYIGEHKEKIMNQEEWDILTLDNKIDILDMAIKDNVTIDEILDAKRKKIKKIEIK